MRYGSLLFLGLLVLWPVCLQAHPEDEFPQVTVQADISDERAELIVNLPARFVYLEVFKGTSPVDLDKMQPEDLGKKVGAMLAERCPLWIDGVEVRPTIITAVVKMSNSRLPARRFPESQVLDLGTLQFLARYETKGAPRSIKINWDLYANFYDDEDEPFYHELDLTVVALVSAENKEHVVVLHPGEPVYTWHSEKSAGAPAGLGGSTPVRAKVWRVPVLAGAMVLIGLLGAAVVRGGGLRIGVAGAGVALGAVALALPVGWARVSGSASAKPLEEPEALAVFESLHRNIYRAFDYRDEGAVYDALARSVDGPMLETIYNDVYQSLIVREENGAVSKVVRVAIDEAELLPAEPDASQDDAGAYRVRCAWTVDGLVTHAGHSHARTNAFEALYTVAPRSAGWRIVDATILDQRRTDDGNQTATDLLETPTQP